MTKKIRKGKIVRLAGESHTFLYVVMDDPYDNGTVRVRPITDNFYDKCIPATDINQVINDDGIRDAIDDHLDAIGHLRNALSL